MHRRISYYIGRSHRQSSYRRLSHAALSAIDPDQPIESGALDTPIENSTKLTPPELLALCLNSRSQVPWYDFVDRFQPVIASVVTKTLRRCMVPNPSLVDDLVQETYLKLCANDLKALRDFDCRHEHALAGFLKVVASNVTQDYLRSSLSQKRGSGKGEDDLEKAIPTAGCVTNSAAAMEQAIMIRQIQRCLVKQSSEPNSKRDCKIFSLYYRHGLTAHAIARYPGIDLSVKGVESALFRITQMLKAKLNKPWRRDLSSSKASAVICLLGP